MGVRHNKTGIVVKNGVSDGSLKRITLRAGMKSARRSVYDELRGVHEYYMRIVVKNAALYAENNKRKTITLADVEASLQLLGATIYGSCA